MIEIREVAAHVAPVTTRLPFRYGIAEMTAAPHVSVEVRLGRDDGAGAGDAESRGWASEHLPPKWFTKDPATTFADDLPALVEVVAHAVEIAQGLRGSDAFSLWRELDARQSRWAEEKGIPGLLAGLGTALVERALIDAVCRQEGVPFARALADGLLGFAPAELHPELAGADWRAHLRLDPDPSIAVRHTVGFADALTADEATDRPDDDLPVTLDEVLRRDGVRFLKIKTAGDAAADLVRLARIFEVCDAAGIAPRLTIDGNESMRDGDHLRRWARSLLDDATVGRRLRRDLVAIEQPMHRDAASLPELAGVLAELAADGVRVIVDESDGDVTAVRRALDLGYAGGTYKGCKGVFRGLANTVLVGHRSAAGAPGLLMTAEDLSTLPPLTVPQDLVVAAVMGLSHIERNGHHFFGRLAPLGRIATDSPVAAGLSVASGALITHPDLYHADGGSAGDPGARLRIVDGRLNLGSVLRAPFGFTPELDLSSLPPLSVEAAQVGL